MKETRIKLLRIAALVGGGIVIMRLVGPKLGKGMDRMFEEASDDFPPKWMYLNITAIRENTERLLETLAAEPTNADATVG